MDIMITDHACERYAERVLLQALPTKTLEKNIRMEDIRVEIKNLIHVDPRLRYMKHYKISANGVVFVISGLNILTCYKDQTRSVTL